MALPPMPDPALAPPRTLSATGARRPHPNPLCRLAALLAFSLLPAAAHAALTCQAPALQAPCGVRSLHGPALEPGPDSGIGNPIQLPSGEKYLQEIDVPPPAHLGHPAWIRLYRSGRLNDGPLGRGWQHGYDIRLQALTDGWRLEFPDGRSLRFDARGRALGAAGAGRLDLSDPNHPQWHDAQAPNAERPGRNLRFDSMGRLLAIVEPDGQRLTLDYYGMPATAASDAVPWKGLLWRVSNPADTLQLHYEIRHGAPRLVRLDTPLGRFAYTYLGQPARLHTIQRPDGMRRIHHYEPERQAGRRHVLTGVTLQDTEGRGVRLRTWRYDAAGRVVQASTGQPRSATRPLTVDYDPPQQPSSPATSPAHRARTRLQAGQAWAVLQHDTKAGRSVLEQAQGQACPTCPVHETRFGYDAQGRLARVGDLTLGRDTHGRLRTVRQARGGWPGLALQHDAQGRRTAWSSALTGPTRLHYGTDGGLQQVEWADARRMALRHDGAGRPVRLYYTGPQATAVDIRVQWRGPWPERLTHPKEVETLTRDPHGRVVVHHVQRPLKGGGRLSYQEHFAYDARNRLIRHALPEGGVLHYRWSDPATLRSLIWEDPHGQHHPVVTTRPGQAGYRYGNGLHLQARTQARGHAGELVLSRGSTPLWRQHLSYDADGRIVGHRQWQADGGLLFDRHLGYDAQDRQVVQLDAARSQWWAWHPDGSLGAQAENGDTTHLPPIQRNPAGLPVAIGPRTLIFNAQGRLGEVRQDGQPLVRHTYNARGHQIRSEYAHMRIERYYLDNRLVGVWQHATASPEPTGFRIRQRYLYAQQVPVGLLETDASGRTRLYYVHADLQGTPVRITDDAGKPRWQAVYDGFGRVLRATGDLQFPLRRPGQVEDPATGWYDNVFRTYLPERGHYLEPDPLGPLPGQQALGHAAQRFLRHADPLGLILLAFDGTRQDAGTGSNVWKLAQIYTDGAAYYHSGPGSSSHLTWDAVTAASSQQILKNQWQSLLNSLERARGLPTPLPIDILGFSRGAALAREFANQIARNTQNGWFSYDDPLRGAIGACVDLRFMGLFDTVAQFGLLGSANAGYDLTIASAWQWVAHAVAVHEYRVLFPLVSVRDSAAGYTVEAPFIGAHGDIGGGLLGDGAGGLPAGDLSDVALNWMAWQAWAAQVPLAALPAADRDVSQPLLHDERPPLLRGLAPGDRLIQDSAARNKGLQGADPELGQAQRQLFEAFIDRSPEAGQAAHVVGRVDMQAYDQWLQTQQGPGGPLAQPRPL